MEKGGYLYEFSYHRNYFSKYNYIFTVNNAIKFYVALNDYIFTVIILTQYIIILPMLLSRNESSCYSENQNLSHATRHKEWVFCIITIITGVNVITGLIFVIQNNKFLIYHALISLIPRVLFTSCVQNDIIICCDWCHFSF